MVGRLTRFYVLLNSISVISGQWDGDNESNAVPLTIVKISASRTGTARSAAKRLTTELPELLHNGTQGGC